MGNQDGTSNNVRRRSVLKSIAAGTMCFPAAVGAEIAIGTKQPTAIQFVGGIDGWRGQTPNTIAGEINPTIQLEPGTQYNFIWENVDGLPHNFVIMDAQGDYLIRSEIISEESAMQTVTFTAEEEMAEYLCEIHPNSMRGNISTEGTLLEIISTEEGEYRYTVVLRGDVEKTRVSEKIASQNNDVIEQRDDGTAVIHGFTGNPGYGDAFRIDGRIVDFEHVDGDADVVIRVDGDEVSPEELGSLSYTETDSRLDSDPSVFAVISTEEGEINYRVLVRGTVEKTSISEKVASQNNDEIRERDDGTVVIEGYTGNPGYGDAFEVTGEIITFERTGGDADVRLELDGEDVTDQYLDES